MRRDVKEVCPNAPNDARSTLLDIEILSVYYCGLRHTYLPQYTGVSITRRGYATVVVSYIICQGLAQLSLFLVIADISKPIS